MNKLFLVMLTMLTGTFLFGQPNVDILHKDLVDKIIQNDHFCVKGYDENKIYIKPQNILVSDNGIFIDLNGFESYPLSNLQSNLDGCFLKIYPELCAGCASKPEKCPECDEYPWSNKERCDNPNCERFEKKIKEE